MAWTCEKYNSLPEAGGVLDQPFALMDKMTVLSNVYGAMSRWHNAGETAIHSLTDGERRILKSLIDMGLMGQ